MDSKKQPRSFVSYLKVFLDFGFYLLIVPFQINYRKLHEDLLHPPSLNPFQIHTNIFQKVLSGLLYGLAIYHHLICFQHPEFNSFSSKGLLSYLGYFQKVISVGYMYYSIILFWRRRNWFLVIFRDIHGLGFPCSGRILISFKLLMISFWGWTLYCLPFELLHAHGDDGIAGANIHEYNFTIAANEIYQRSQSTFFENISGEIPDLGLEELASLPFWHTFFCVFYFILFLANGVLVSSLELMVIFFIVITWNNARSFKVWYKKVFKDVESCCKKEDAAEILKKYQLMLRIIRTTNKIIGPGILLAIAFCLPIYATFAGMILHNGLLDGEAMLLMSIHYGIYFTEVVLAAEVHRMGNEFIRLALSPKMIDNVPYRTLTSMSMDMNSNAFALKGCGFFSLSYSFLASIFGAMITYTIIVVQFQSSDCKDPA